jgi:dephospho-CoA kinase
MVEKIRAASSLKRRVFIEGLRTPDEIKCLRNAFPDIIVIGVVASQLTRVKRAVKRNRWDDPKFEDEILQKDAQEAAWGVNEALKIADVTLENDGNSIDELKSKVAKLIERLLQKEQDPPPSSSQSLEA